MTKWLFIASVLALAFMVIRDWESAPIEHSPGILVNETPLQRNVQASQFMVDDYVLTRKASFEIRARVLSTEPYYMGRTADLSPVDFALGWGPMSDQAVLDVIKVSQSGRWYRTRWDRPPPIPDQAIISSSSNMHMIPADSSIERSLKRVRKGDIVRLQGFLVDVDHPSGFYWRSSMSRNDTGDGACELVYVESVMVETQGS
jgi:hypothetical protein